MVKQFDLVKPFMEKLLLPLVFTLHYLINVAFYYLGLCFVENSARQTGFIVISIIFAIVSGVMFLWAIKNKCVNVRIWALIFFIAIYFGIYFIIGLRDESAFIKLVLPNFIVFCIPSFLVGIYSAKLHTEKYFISTMEKIGFFIFPIALIYFNQVIFNCNPSEYGRDLGVINYMSFAYTLMPFLVVLVLQFVNDEELILPIIKKRIQHKRLVRGTMILIYWLGLYSSGTRGAIVCIGIGLLLIGVYRIVRKLNIKAYFIIVCLMIGLLVVNMFVFTPEGMKGIERSKAFVAELEKGEFRTSNEASNVSASVDEMVAQETIDENIRISDRGTLYKLAMSEFLKSPVKGMGPGAYTDKYGIYPHNVILEMFAELGIIGALPLVIVIVFAIINLLIHGWKNKNTMAILLFFLIYAVRANISGSLWECDVLLCAIGYGVAYDGCKEKNNI